MSITWNVFFGNLQWMRWNLFLAVIPLVLSFILFVNPRLYHNEREYPPRRLSRKFWWWFTLGIFILFLPNAAYTITDIIHLVADIRDKSPFLPRNGIIFVIIPQYLVFLLLGFQCHVISVMNIGYYLRRNRWVNQLLPVELAINLLCAFGVYLGRFNRLNSWHLFTHPTHLIDNVIDNLDSWYFFLGTLIFFITINFLYYIFKWLNLSIWYGWRMAVKDL